MAEEIICQMCGKVVLHSVYDGCIDGVACCPFCGYHLY